MHVSSGLEILSLVASVHLRQVVAGLERGADKRSLAVCANSLGSSTGESELHIERCEDESEFMLSPVANRDSFAVCFPRWLSDCAPEGHSAIPVFDERELAEFLHHHKLGHRLADKLLHALVQCFLLVGRWLGAVTLVKDDGRIARFPVLLHRRRI